MPFIFIVFFFIHLICLDLIPHELSVIREILKLELKSSAVLLPPLLVWVESLRFKDNGIIEIIVLL